MTKEQMNRNEKLAAEIIDYLCREDVFEETALYLNNKKYSSEKSGSNATATTFEGNSYYVTNDIDVSKQLEYFNSETVTMTFEGELYDALHYDCKAEEDLNKIASKYGLHLDYGHDWNLAFYEN